MYERVTEELNARLKTLTSSAEHTRRFISDTQDEIAEAQKRLAACEATMEQMRAAVEMLTD